MEEEYALFMRQIEQAVAIFKEINKNKPIRIIGHLDSDGISSTSILIRSLIRENRNYSVSIVQSLSKEFLEELSREDYPVYMFVDIGAGQLKTISSYLKDKIIFVLDHHKPSKYHNGIIHINPHLQGINGSTEIAAAGVVFLFAKTLNKKNMDMAHIAIIGAIGDVQEDKGFKGLNQEILDMAVDSDKIRVERNLTLFGLQTKPLWQALANNPDIFIPGITGSKNSTINFLRSIGLIRNKENIKYNELDKKQKQKLKETIQEKRKNIKDGQDVFGNVYLLTREKEGSPLRDAREFSTLLNSCGRLGKASLGIGVCLGNEKDKIRAGRLLQEYKKEIIGAINWYKKNVGGDRVIKGKNYIIINARDNIRASLAGTLASILTNSNKTKKGTLIMTLAHNDYKEIKVSLRIAGKTSGINLRKIMKDITKETGGEAGGHKNAAGAIIDAEKEEEFIKQAKKILKKEILQEQKKS